MVDERTDNLIQAYMKWTNQHTLKPEEFLLFRQQAVKEELAGIDTVKTADMAGSGESETCNAHHFSQGKKHKRQIIERREPSSIPKDRPVEAGSEDNRQEENQSSNQFGVSDSEFIEFMNSAED